MISTAKGANIKTDSAYESAGATLPAQTQFHGYGAALNKRKWHILLLVLAAIAAAFFAGNSNEYRSSVLVSVSPAIMEKFPTPMALNFVVGGDKLLNKVIDDTGYGYSASELRSRVKAEFTGGTGLIIIHITDARLQRAQKIANSLAKNFVAIAADLDTSPERMLARLSTINKQIAFIDTTIGETAGLPASKVAEKGAQNNISAEIADLKHRLSTLDERNLTEIDRTLMALSINQQLANLEDRQITFIKQRYDLAEAKSTLLAELEKIGTTKVIARASLDSPRTAEVFKRLVVAAVAALIGGVGWALLANAYHRGGPA